MIVSLLPPLGRQHGKTLNLTWLALSQAAAEGLPVALMLTKLDRLITELKLPPNDAYHKLRHTIEEVNTLILQYGGPDAVQVSSTAGFKQLTRTIGSC